MPHRYCVQMGTSGTGGAALGGRRSTNKQSIPVAYLSAAETAQALEIIDSALRRDADERREKRIAELKAELARLDPAEVRSLDPDRLREDRDERKRLEKEG